MKVFAINSSPKMGEGNTALIPNPFLDGMMSTEMLKAVSRPSYPLNSMFKRPINSSNKR